MTELVGVDERIVTTGATPAPDNAAAEFARRFSVVPAGSDPFNGSIGFEFSYRSQVIVAVPAPEAPTVADESRVEPVRTTSPFSRLRERGTRLGTNLSNLGQRIESGLQNELFNFITSTRSALSHGHAELTATRERIIEAMTPRSRKVERAQQAATIILEEPILSVPPVYDGGAADKRAYLSTWITPTQVHPEAQDETPDGETVTHYHYNDTGKAVVQEMIDAVRADAVRTQAEFSIASEALKKAYDEAKKDIEATVIGSISPSEKARAAAQIELVRRITSTARLRAYNSLRSAERERRLAQPAAPISQDVLDNRARAEAILTRIYTDLNIDRLPYTPDATRESELWREVSSRIALHYDMSHVEAELLFELDSTVNDENSIAMRGYYEDSILKSARRACATARLMAWNQMTRPEPVVPAEAIEIVKVVEEAEPVVPVEDDDLIEAKEEPEIIEPDGADPQLADTEDTVIVETGAGRRMRLTRANRLYLTAAAVLLLGITGVGTVIYGNSTRNFRQISAAQAAEAALADQQARQLASGVNDTQPGIQAQAPVVEATTLPREGFRSLRSFSFTRPTLHRAQPAAVQTFEAANADKQHDAQATEDAKPERTSRINYASGKPVKISVTCGDRVIEFVRKGKDNNPQDVRFDYFASADDIPEGYVMPVDRAQRVMHGGIPITVYHSESDGEQEAAGDFQDYVLRNGGPNILPGCRYTAEQEGDNGDVITEVSKIVDAFLMPARVADPILGERDIDPDDVVNKVNTSLGQRYPQGEQPRVDGVDLTCYSFAHGAQEIDGIHYGDRETTRSLVWVLSQE